MITGSNGEVEWHELKVQPDAQVDQFCDQLIVNLRSDWEPKPGQVYTKGSLLVVPIVDFVKKGTEGSNTL